MPTLDEIRRRKVATATGQRPATSDLQSRLKSLSAAGMQAKPVSKGAASLDRISSRHANDPDGLSQYAEIRRIVEMQIVLPMTDEEMFAYNHANVNAAAFNDGFRLFDIQAEAVCAFETWGGLFAPIGVGWGKTLVTLMCANKAYLSGTPRIILMIPPHLLPQLVENDIKWARTKVPMNMPIHVLGGRGSKTRIAMAKSRKKGLYIMPYSLLSTRDTVDLLENIRPGLIICDECQYVSRHGSARTDRLFKHIEVHRPAGVCCSGTITQKSVRDYRHLAQWCLGDRCPLPLSASFCDQWASVIDADSGGEDVEHTDSASGPLKPLVKWAQRHFPDDRFPETTSGFRKAYKYRLNTTPGVVASGDADIGTSITMVNQPVQNYKGIEGWDRLEELIRQVNDMWLTPNGDEIEHAIHTWKWLNELSAGFYNELVWPEVPVFAERKRISEDEAEDILKRARNYHALGQLYAKELRHWLETHSLPRLDTPFLVGSDMAHYGSKHVGESLYQTWREWKEADFEGRPDRDSHAVRVCPFKINAALEWAQGLDRGGIIWVYHIAMGQWVADTLHDAGLEVLHCPAGPEANRSIIDKSNRDKIIVASMTAHGTGKNLQHFQEQFFLQWPRDARMAEQTLGRTHRNGQEADELFVHTCSTLEFDQLNFAACLNDALYVHQTTGMRQKLIYANYTPLPKVFPSAVLKERGAENVKMLNAGQQTLLREKFSG